MSEPLVAPQAVAILVTKEPFCDWFTLTMPNGFTEELDAEQATQWFKERGANMPAIEKFLDHVWNFYKGVVEIQNFKEPKSLDPKTSPNI